MNNANKSGIKLETCLTMFLNDNDIPVFDYKNIKNTSKLELDQLPYYGITQYKHLDIFNANARIDILLVNNTSGKKFYIECKNQAVGGSVDQKFPYYIHNITNNKYDGELVFLLNTKGIRSNVLNWLVENSEIYNYYILSIDNMERILEIMMGISNQRVFIENTTTIKDENSKVFPLSPPIKWAGGKRAIMKTIMENIPTEFGDYFEPFIGGGSVLLELFNRGKLKNKKIYVSDINQPLINMYQVIKDQPYQLISELQGEMYQCKEHYYSNRDTFNKLKKQPETYTVSQLQVKLAALFIYLNKYCFNGMYRENRTGGFNVPIGSQNNPTLIGTENILNISKSFRENNVVVQSCDYKNILHFVKRGDFVYLDPPYDETFTDYTKEKFEKQQQKELRIFMDELTERNVYVSMSNSNTQFINELYNVPHYKQYILDTKRLINSNGDNRKNIVQETITRNF
jgi:DNA adenine methylase